MPAAPLQKRPPVPATDVPPNYKWIVLSNTTIGMLLATINSSILLIALPDIFRGIHIDPLAPGNTNYLLWMILSFLVVTAVLVVSLGRLGDMYGRVRMYNLGFAVFTAFSILLAVTPLTGSAGALWLIGMRVGQGVGGAMLFANSSAIITDSFPANQRGLALGINGVAAIAGSFLGLILGGLLGPVQWRLVFLVSVPFGLLGTFRAYTKLVDISERRPTSIDWLGNVTFAVGLVAVMVGITYGIQPYGHHTMGWTSPKVLAELIGGVLVLVLFGVIETRVAEPMFNLNPFRIRAFTAGNVATLLSAIGRGGLQFVLIIWLQGIWLPLHGYSYTQTPLWAGIYLLPLTAGFLVAGPLSGFLSDKYGARPFATGGMILAAISFILLEQLPVNFSYVAFAALLLLNGIGMGLFASPNRAGVMNSLPPSQRGAGGGMNATFQNSAMVLSIGLFFSLLIVGLSAGLPASLQGGLEAHGVPAAQAVKIAHLPPVASLFAAFLGANPIKQLLGPLLPHLAPHQAAVLTGRGFFPTSDQLAVLQRALVCVHVLVRGLPDRRRRLVAARGEVSLCRRRLRSARARAGGPAMTLVAISASYGAGGAVIGPEVAGKLGVPFVDRAIPLAVAKELDVPLDDAEAHDEEAPAPSWLDRLLRGFINTDASVPTPVPPSSYTSEDFRQATESVLLRQAETGSGVILGRGAVIVLRERPEVLRVRLDGPRERRIRQAMRLGNVDQASAEAALERLDRTHAEYARQLYRVDLSDPSLYHLVIDSTALGATTCVGLIAEAARDLSARAAGSRGQTTSS